MALTKDAALEAVRSIVNGPRAQEMSRLNRIHEALRPSDQVAGYTPTVSIPTDAPLQMKELARKAETNYLPLLVKTFGQVMKVDGYLTKNDQGGTDPWVWWQRNRMDSRQTGPTRGALSYGASYATALPGTYGRNQPGPSISLYSPREMTALYQDTESDEWPMLALGIDGRHVTLFDEENLYRFGMEKSPSSFEVYPTAASIEIGADRLTYIETLAHGLGVCPVVRYRDRNLLCGEESYGIVEPLMIVQERIDETTFEMLVAQYFQAFKQRYVLGWIPKNQDEELKASAARIWYLNEDPADVKIDQLEAGQIQPYIDSRNSAIRDFAAMGQLPVQAFGVDGISNISDATLAGLEAAKYREAGEITTSLGESHEQLLRLCAFIDGNQTAAEDYSAEVRWRNMESRSFAATVDGLVKLVQGLGLDPAIALEDVPGMTEQRMERAIAEMRRTQGASVLALLNQPPANALPATA